MVHEEAKKVVTLDAFIKDWLLKGKLSLPPGTKSIGRNKEDYNSKFSPIFNEGEIKKLINCPNSNGNWIFSPGYVTDEFKGFCHYSRRI